MPEHLTLIPEVDIDLALVPSHRPASSDPRPGGHHPRRCGAAPGIPHYWILDLDARPTLTASHLAGEFGFVDAPPVIGTYTAEQPFPVRLDLDGLG